MCTYGAGCNRPGCIYRHPPKGAVPKTEAICMPFVAGFCEFGGRCRNVHPCESEAGALRHKYARTPCEWGAQCRNKLCLYSHPQQADELAAYGLASMGLHGTTESATARHDPPMPLLPGGVWQEDLHDAGQLTWEERRKQLVAASNADRGSRPDHAPDDSGAVGASLPGAEAFSTADPDVAGDAPRCAECGRASDGCVDATDGCFYCDACWDLFDGEATADANGATPLEESLAEGVSGSVHPQVPHLAPPAACAALSGQPGGVTPATAAAAIYPAAIHSASEAGGASETAACGHARGPAPAPYAPSGAWAFVANRSAANGGTRAGGKEADGGGSGANTAGGGTGGGIGKASGFPRSREVVLPEHVWLPEVGRTAAAAFSIADPLARFHAVNAPYRARGERLPLMFGSEEARGAAMAGGGIVLDLHFQSAKTAPQVGARRRTDPLSPASVSSRAPVPSDTHARRGC
jgi:hypothetical protein